MNGSRYETQWCFHAFTSFLRKDVGNHSEDAGEADDIHTPAKTWACSEYRGPGQGHSDTGGRERWSPKHLLGIQCISFFKKRTFCFWRGFRGISLDRQNTEILLSLIFSETV